MTRPTSLTWYAALTCEVCRNIIKGAYVKQGGGFLAKYRCVTCKPYKPR